MQELTRSGGLLRRTVHNNEHAEAIATDRVAVDRAVTTFMVSTVSPHVEDGYSLILVPFRSKITCTIIAVS